MPGASSPFEGEKGFALDGTVLYRERLRDRGLAFSASPVAADGKIYLASEDGDVYVVRAGEDMELIAVNPLAEVLMATPAISEGTLFVRGFRSLFAIAKTRAAAGDNPL